MYSIRRLNTDVSLWRPNITCYVLEITMRHEDRREPWELTETAIAARPVSRRAKLVIALLTIAILVTAGIYQWLDEPLSTLERDVLATQALVRELKTLPDLVGIEEQEISSAV